MRIGQSFVTQAGVLSQKSSDITHHCVMGNVLNFLNVKTAKVCTPGFLYSYAFQEWLAAVSLWGPQNHFNGNEDDLAAFFVGYLPGHSGPEKLVAYYLGLLLDSRTGKYFHSHVVFLASLHTPLILIRIWIGPFSSLQGISVLLHTTSPLCE